MRGASNNSRLATIACRHLCSRHALCIALGVRSCLPAAMPARVAAGSGPIG
jgi:hypothetical protein